MDVLGELLDIDWASVSREIVGFVRDYVESSGASGVVIGLSGGVDSSVTLALLARAIDPKRILGLVMPTSFTPRQDVEDALYIAKSLGIRYKLMGIDGVVEEFKRTAGIEEGSGTRIAIANLRARVRMSLLYLHANMENLLVAGTSDKSELLLGYYTKYGDGASDFLVISHLYKTQVRRLGKELGLPERIYAKPSSPQLYPGHRAVDELPADYEVIDQILYLVFDKGLGLRETASRLFIDPSLVASVIRRYLSTKHKRALPQAPKTLSIAVDEDRLRRELEDLGGSRA